jgi:hypothetical protein
MSEVQPTPVQSTPVQPTPKIPVLVPVQVLLIPAHRQLGKPARLPGLRAGRPTAMACATRASGQPAAGGPRRSGGRQCGYVTIPPVSASDAQPAAQGFSLRYPRGN